MNVVLPAPLVPISPTISPALTSIVTSSTATSPPKRTETRSVRSAGSAAGRGGAVRASTATGRLSTCRRGCQPVRRATCSRRPSRARCTSQITVREVQDDHQHPDPAGEQLDLVRPVEDRRDPHHDQRAEHRTGDRRDPADDSHRQHEQRLGRWELRRAASWCSPATGARPRVRRCRPTMANATSFIRVGEIVYAAALPSLSRTAIIDRPIPERRNPPREDEHDDQHGEAHVVEGALVAHVPRSDVGRG